MFLFLFTNLHVFAAFFSFFCFSFKDTRITVPRRIDHLQPQHASQKITKVLMCFEPHTKNQVSEARTKFLITCQYEFDSPALSIGLVETKMPRFPLNTSLIAASKAVLWIFCYRKHISCWFFFSQVKCSLIGFIA